MKIELTPIQVLNLLSIAKAEKLAEERNIEKLKKSYPNDEISSEWLEDISSIVESLHNSYSQFLNEE
jgi:gluconate kinase